MEKIEGAVGVAIGQRREGRQCRGVRPGTGVQPPLGERDQEGIDTVAADRVDALQSALVVAVSRVLQAENEGGQPGAVVDLDEAPRDGGRCLYPTLGGQQRHSAAQQRGIVGIRVQDTLQMLGRCGIVAPGVGVEPDEIAADRRAVVAVGAGRGLRRQGRRLLIGGRQAARADPAYQTGGEGTAQPADRAATAAARTPPTLGRALPCPTCWHNSGRPRLRAPPIRCSAWGP